MTRIYAILGPTASGKSAVAFQLALERGAPILSVDSMQVYRGMDIGTAKPGLAEQVAVRHYMIDLVDPEQEYSVAEFQQAARRILAEHDEVFVVGGSGLHFRSIVDPFEFAPTDPALRSELEDLEDPVAVLIGADPRAARVVDITNRRRVLRAIEIHRLTGLTPSDRALDPDRTAIREYRSRLPFRAIGLDPGDLLPGRVRNRFIGMLRAGLPDEVERLQGRLGRTAGGAVGYRELSLALEEGIPERAAWSLTVVATKRLARRQRTFFKRDPRIEWLPWESELGRMLIRARTALGL